jgi:hypothetical protein
VSRSGLFVGVGVNLKVFLALLLSGFFAVQADSLWGNVLGQVATGNESVEDAVDFALDGLRDAVHGWPAPVRG